MTISQPQSQRSRGQKNVSFSTRIKRKQKSRDLRIAEEAKDRCFVGAPLLLFQYQLCQVKLLSLLTVDKIARYTGVKSDEFILSNRVLQSQIKPRLCDKIAFPAGHKIAN